jgi:3'-5' exoribonuclease
MLNELREKHFEHITNPLYRHLISEMILKEPMFKKAPAASKMHHPWIGGLLEHVLGLCNLYDSIYEKHYDLYFPNLNADLVKTTLMLHDWGKILEYDSTSPGFPITKLGTLLHHIGIVVRKVTILTDRLRNSAPNNAELQDITKDEINLLHGLYSHHGKPEWQSLVRPATAEALFVHWLDNFDAQIMNMRESLEGPEGSLEGFTEKNWAHGTSYEMQAVTEDPQR